jgi:CDP-glycerol glycerophosphotransferase
VWAYRGKIHTSDPNTTVVQRLSPAYFWHLGRAKYWVNSQNFPHYMSRRPDKVFVQTWHGTPLKRMLLDIAEMHGRDAGYVDRMTHAAAQWSVLVSPSPYATKAISGAYGYSGPTLEVGYPRNDILMSPDRDRLREVVRTRLGIGAEARVILYAPTFRDDQSDGGRFKFNLPFDLERLQQRLGPDTVVLLRMHVLVSNRLTIPAEYEQNVLDVSAYPEIQELYLASDAVITDYSSVFFDFALLRRPIVFYAYDLEKYRDQLRGFYLDYLRDLPGPIVTTEDELLDTLDDLDAVATSYAPRFDDFIERFGPNDDGHAAERVVDAVFGRARVPEQRPKEMS